MSDDTTTTEPAEDVADEAPAHVPQEGHTTLLDASIIDAAATPLAWDDELPADGIVEHNSPGEYVDSMVVDAPADDAGDGQGDADKPTPAKKAPAKKAPAKKAAPRK